MERIGIKRIDLLILFLFAGLLLQCGKPSKGDFIEGKQAEIDHKEQVVKENKKVIYQVFTRLFGNENNRNKPWGTSPTTTAAARTLSTMGLLCTTKEMRTKAAKCATNKTRMRTM